jgi:hypothetical protein
MCVFAWLHLKAILGWTSLSLERRVHKSFKKGWFLLFHKPFKEGWFCRLHKFFKSKWFLPFAQIFQKW